jgi:hypothetical protein
VTPSVGKRQQHHAAPMHDREGKPDALAAVLQSQLLRHGKRTLACVARSTSTALHANASSSLVLVSPSSSRIETRGAILTGRAATLLLDAARPARTHRGGRDAIDHHETVTAKPMTYGAIAIARHAAAAIQHPNSILSLVVTIVASAFGVASCTARYRKAQRLQFLPLPQAESTESRKWDQIPKVGPATGSTIAALPFSARLRSVSSSTSRRAGRAPIATRWSRAIPSSAASRTRNSSACCFTATTAGRFTTRLWPAATHRGGAIVNAMRASRLQPNGSRARSAEFPIPKRAATPLPALKPFGRACARGASRESTLGIINTQRRVRYDSQGPRRKGRKHFGADDRSLAVLSTRAVSSARAA